MQIFPPTVVAYERNKLIAAFLKAAKGEEVHYSDIAYFLSMDRGDLNCWMRKYRLTRWENGKNSLWWKLSVEKDDHKKL